MSEEQVGCERCRALVEQVRRVRQLERAAEESKAAHDRALSVWAAAEEKVTKAMKRGIAMVEAEEQAGRALEDGEVLELRYHAALAAWAEADRVLAGMAGEEAKA